MGQLPFNWQAPDGYPDAAAAWINTNGLLNRWNFALALATNKIKGTHVDLQATPSASMALTPAGLVNYWAGRLLGRPLAPADRAGLTAFVSNGRPADSELTARLKELYQSQALAFVHAAGSPDPTHSHFDAQDYMERGTPGEKSIPTGWLARHVQSAASTNKSPFRAVGLGAVMQASLRGPVPAVALQSIADFHLKGRPGAAGEIARLQAELASLYQVGSSQIDDAGQDTFSAMQALGQLVSPSASGPAAGPGPAKYVPANGAAYPATMFGEAMATVAQLIKASIGLEIACVDLGGWDTHVGEGAATGGQLPRLLQELGSTLHAFYTDLQDQMGHITVVTMSEFGRRVMENGSYGTDHGHGNCMLLMGKGVLGGKVYGQWPGLTPTEEYGPGDLAVTTDFRDVLAEVVQKRLLNSALATVFPGYQPHMRGLLSAAQQAMPMVS